MAKPKVFVNSINKSIKNNKESYHFRGNILNDIEMIDDSNVVKVDVNSKINNIFNSESFVYKCLLEITLNNGNKIYEDVIAVKDSNLITLSNKKIKISDIMDIKKAN